MILYKKAQQGSLIPSVYDALRYKDWYTKQRGIKYDPSKSKYKYREYWDAGGRDMNDTAALKPFLKDPNRIS